MAYKKRGNMAKKKEIPLTNDPEVMAQFERIKSQKQKILNKLGQWYYSDDPNKFNIVVRDMRAVLK